MSGLTPVLGAAHFEREELIIADLDLAEIDKESMTLDVTGHYSRPDIFRFELKDP